MNASTNLPGATGVSRSFAVEFDQSYLPRPLDWRLRIWGASVGGYGTLKGTSSRYADKARAELAGTVWLMTGITPAFQTDADRAPFEAALTPELENV